MDNVRRRAYRKAELEYLPAQLADKMTDIAYWQKRVDYWEHKTQTIDPSEPWYARALERLKCCHEILDVMKADARQLNRKLAP